MVIVVPRQRDSVNPVCLPLRPRRRWLRRSCRRMYWKLVFRTALGGILYAALAITAIWVFALAEGVGR